MTRKSGFALVLILSLLGLLVSGCSGQQTQPRQEAPKAQVIELKFHHHDPANGPSDQAAREWAKAVEERAKGTLKITVYPAETLGKGKDAYDLVTSGIADIAWGFTGFFPGRFPMTEVASLPLIGMPTAEIGSKALWDLYSKTTYLKDEYPGVKVLFLHTAVPTGTIGTVKKPVRKLEDLKGLKLRAGTGPDIEFLKLAGAVPMPVAAGDVYEGLQRGTLDGYVWVVSGAMVYRLPEVSNYHTMVQLSVPCFWMIMNEKKYESLPVDAQKALDECSGVFGLSVYTKRFDGLLEEFREAVRNEWKKEIIQLAPEEETRWRELAKKTWEKWVADGEAKGLPARAVLDEYQKLLKLHSGK